MKKIFMSAALITACYLCQAQHTLILKNGEKMNGTLQTVKDGTISFLFKGNAMNFKMTEISSIVLDAKQEEQKATSSPSEAGMRGISYVMAGRTLVKPPKIDNLTLEKGVVVVVLTIDKDGNVRKAEPGAEGTTTTSNYLLTKAKQAAQTVQFDKCPKCPLESQGSITITF